MGTVSRAIGNDDSDDCGASRPKRRAQEEGHHDDSAGCEQPLESASSRVGASNIYEEGIVAGLIGAATIAIWFLILDAIEGRPFYTPTVLATALFHGGAGLTSPEHLPASFELVLWFTSVHVLIFIVIGGAASGLLRLAARDPNFGFGIVLFLVFFMFGFIGVGLMFAEEVLHALAWPTILKGCDLPLSALRWRRAKVGVEPMPLTAVSDLPPQVDKELHRMIVRGNRSKGMMERLSKNPKIQVLSGPETRSVNISFNNPKKPFDDVRMRRALGGYGIDRQAIAKVPVLGPGRALWSFVPPGEKDHIGFDEQFPYNPDKAKALLKEVGFDHKTPLKCAIMTYAAEPSLPTVAILSKRKWPRSGSR